MVSAAKQRSLHAQIVSGSVVLLTGSGLTMAINLGYNIVIARYLGARGFGQATAIYTLLVVLSALTLSFQIVAAKVIAQQPTAERKSAVYRHFHRVSWICGLVVGVGLEAFQRAVSDYLNLPNSGLIAIIAVGAMFYVPLGTRRGFIQGECGFRNFAFNLTLEQAARFAGSYGLILAGGGLTAVIAANSVAILICYFAIPVRLTGRLRNPLSRSDAARELTQAAVFFAGQMLICNCGIVLVKHYFLAQEAGLYAAVATVGRVIFSLSQAVVNTAFPLVAATKAEERKDLRLIATCLVLVLGVGAATSVVLWFAPAAAWTHILGREFVAPGRYGISELMSLYAMATVIYSMAALIIAFEMAYKIANSNWLQLAFSGILIAGICESHVLLQGVILVQLALMAVFFVMVSVPLLYSAFHDTEERPRAGVLNPARQ
jgi:O-antigen/teichoic acid export membrane protein